MSGVKGKNYLFDYIKGRAYWLSLIKSYSIDYSKVVLVLSGDNKKLDEECCRNLWKYAKRKYVDKALIIHTEDNDLAISQLIADDITFQTTVISKEKMNLLYRYYSFHKFFDNIVFTYTDSPRGNLLGRYLRETEVNESDAACLALFHLREIEQ